MKLTILFLLGWFVVGFVVALVVGKLIREVGLKVPDDEYPDRRFKMRRASMSHTGGKALPSSAQAERRHEPDRRKGDHVERQRK